MSKSSVTFARSLVCFCFPSAGTATGAAKPWLLLTARGRVASGSRNAGFPDTYAHMGTANSRWDSFTFKLMVVFMLMVVQERQCGAGSGCCFCAI